MAARGISVDKTGVLNKSKNSKFCFQASKNN
jgi:hypothetical protein